jgi:hypothetical protein
MKLAKRAARKAVRKSVKVRNESEQIAPSPGPGEHIRVVPLHYPKPSISVDELHRQRAVEEEGGELFSDQRGSRRRRRTSLISTGHCSPT